LASFEINRYQLIDGFLDAISFGSHMADVHAPAATGLAGELRQFGRFGVGHDSDFLLIATSIAGHDLRVSN